MQLDAALRQLHDFTHLAFTSRNGIHAVIERLAETAGGADAGVQLLRASGVQLCALGADGELLADFGLEVHLSPPEASTQGLVAELRRRREAAEAARTLAAPPDMRVLCPVPLVTGGLEEPPIVPRFLDGLRAIGAAALRVPAYATRPGLHPDGPSSFAHEAQLLLEEGGVDAVAFSSSAEAQGLALAMGGAERLAAGLVRHGVLLAAHGPYTACGVEEVLGLRVGCVSRDWSSFDGLVTALGEALPAI